MRATSLGHAGILVETAHGSIVCDPWFVPAFFGSWFVFPRNDRLDADLLGAHRAAPTTCTSRTSTATTSTSRGWPTTCRATSRPAPGLPDPRARPAAARRSASPNLIRTDDGDELDLGGLTVAIHVETSITDGPGGDSALVVSDGTSRLVDQNDCRTTDLDALRGPRPGRPALAAVQRGDLVPDGLRARPGDDAGARRRQGREPVRPGRCATSRRSAPAPSCRAPGRRASSTPSCSTST